MSINPYINFAGNCREAVEYYAKIFHSDPQIMTFGEMPPAPGAPPLPEGAKNLVLHAELPIGDTMVMFSDTFPGMPLTTGDNITLAMVTTNRDEILSAFSALKEGGRVTMDLQETFWSKLYGMLTDKYGIPWLFSLDSGEMRR